MLTLIAVALFAAADTKVIESVRVSGNVEVTVMRGDKLAVDADPRLIVEYEGDEVRIKNRPDDRENKAPRATVTLPVLKRLDISGSVYARLDDVKTDLLALALSGSSKLVATGTAKRVSLSANGASQVDTKALTCTDLTLSISGAGAAKVHASESLTAQLSGATSVVYSGSPKNVTRAVSGAASLQAAP